MTTTATPRVITRRDLAKKVTATELGELDVCLHEGLHSVAVALMGGQLRAAAVTRPSKTHAHAHGLTSFDPSMSRDRNAAVGFAGPWGDARWFGGTRPTRHLLQAALDGASPEDRALMTTPGGAAIAINPQLANLLERCFPSALALAGQLFSRGEVRHRDVLAALGLTEENAAFGLASIRSGARPNSFRIDGPVRF